MHKTVSLEMLNGVLNRQCDLTTETASDTSKKANELYQMHATVIRKVGTFKENEKFPVLFDRCKSNK